MVKVPVLRCNIGSFAVQNRHFYNAKQGILQHIDNKLVTHYKCFEKLFTYLSYFLRS